MFLQVHIGDCQSPGVTRCDAGFCPDYLRPPARVDAGPLHQTACMRHERMHMLHGMGVV